MVLTLNPELDAAVTEAARSKGVAPEALALEVLHARFLGTPSVAPRDEWSRRLLSAVSHCGVSLPPEALTSEGLYD